MTVLTAGTTIDSIKNSLVALRMPRALEVLDATMRRIEQGEIDGIEALDQLLVEERTVRENRRVRMALTLARLTTVKSLAGFDFAFQPSLDKKRILALAELTTIFAPKIFGTEISRTKRFAVEPFGAQHFAAALLGEGSWARPSLADRCADANCHPAAIVAP